ncbi:hypothetical protein BN1708_000317 [Verticillium longisporum]|uniref:Mitochondrial division protein 1 n=1 Tax=Verticillium longisporum TaxID=100787 RepID=A0A0G4KCL5_VERLO|nr:hypothetical protein BN1708_000317 [Verticillium longisporum]
MESSNQENFFETDVQQEKRKQRALKQDNPFGNPIRLPSKVLAVLPDPTNPNALLTAESSGRVARISLTSRKPTTKFAGPAVPVTSLATSGTTLFAGAWDKTIWSWDLRTGAPQRRYAGHADFVKTLAAARLGGRDVLLSGGADKKILVWDVATGRRLHALQDPAAAMMSLQSLAVDPVASSDDELVLVSASSDPVVRRWRVRLDGAEMVAGGEVGGEAAGGAALAAGGAISEHETSVYKVRRYAGHADFVKTLAAARLGGRDVLLSGGADKKILVWDVATGRRLHALQDPAAAMIASSDPVVRRWRVRLDGAEMVAGGEVGGEAAGGAALAAGGAISEHETSVYKVLFDQESEEIDLWTASADGTAKCLARGKGFTTEDTFEHGDFVKGLVLTETWVVTGGFSQDIKVWDRTSGSLVYTISAHFDEITDLIVLRDPSGKKDTLVSISIDRTIRTWSLDKQGLAEAVEEIRKAGEPVEEDEQQAKKDGNKKEGLMTADEEAELAALMDSD